MPCFQRRDHAQRNRDEDGEDDGGDSAIEIDGSTRWPIIFEDRQVGDQASPRSPCRSLFTQVTNCTIRGLVEAERGADALQPFRRGVVAGENCGGIAGVRAEQEEDEQGHHAHHGHGGENSAKEISEQVGSVRLESNRGSAHGPLCHQPNISAIPMPSGPQVLQLRPVILLTASFRGDAPASQQDLDIPGLRLPTRPD